MKHRWLTKPLTKEDIEAITGKKVLSITSGDLETGDPEVTEKGMEIEFEGEVEENKLSALDSRLSSHFRAAESRPPLSPHISTIETIDTSKARPVGVRRTWEGEDYLYDCLVTESVKDQYLAGDIKVGDYVIVHFDDVGEQVVTGKVYKSW